VPTVPSVYGGRASNRQSTRQPGSSDVHHERTIRRSVRSYSSARDSDSRPGASGPDGRFHSRQTSVTPPYGSKSGIPARNPAARPPPPDLDAARGTSRRTAPRGFDLRRCRDGCSPGAVSPGARREEVHALPRAPDRMVSTRDDVVLAAKRPAFCGESRRFASSLSPSLPQLIPGASHQMRSGNSIARWCWLVDTLD
jgi:hypothetical protein